MDQAGPQVTLARLCYASGMTFLGWARFAKVLLAMACVAVIALPASGQQSPLENSTSDAAREALNAGVTSFKAGRYAEAVASFQRATELDSGNENAHLYLGTAYAVQVVPNLETPENIKTGASALAEFDAVLGIHPGELTAMKQEGAIYRNLQRYDRAMDMEKKIAAIEPNDPEPFYIMGFIDWVRAYKNAIQVLAADGLTDDGRGNVRTTRGACDKLRAENSDLVEDGIANLSRAIELNPNYSDAMQYLQLTYRRHADFACGDKAALSTDLTLADQWTREAMEARKSEAGLQQK
jgi:tetratricopeptide (TPR) repeat protein